MADKLTPQQEQAVKNRGGKLLVSAAAGSGKTKVLVDRLLGYLTDARDPANLDEFLIITYTNAAASELRAKIAAKLTERIAQEPENNHLHRQMQRLHLAKISTVHGFCGDLLREYAYRLDIPADFRVADETEAQELRETVLTGLLDQAYETAGENEDFRMFVDSQGLGRDDRSVPLILWAVYSSARCHLDPEGWLQKTLDAMDLQTVTDASQTVWGRFLLEDLHSYVGSQIQALGQCAQRTKRYPEFDKVTANLQVTLSQLEALASADTWDAVVAVRKIQYGTLSFPRKNNPDPDLMERVKAVRNACKENLERKLRCFCDDSQQVLADLSQCAAGTRGLVALVREFGERYDAVKRSRRCLDFGDLEHKTLDLLLGKSRSGPTAAAAEIGRRYREILVDEYQDSNGVQDAIFSALTRQRQNCFLVGDVKQSIYQFRLADPGIFLEKYASYAPAETAEPGQGRKVLLTHNFRSGPEIIDAVNQVFGACMSPRVGGLHYGEAEAMREGVPHDPLPDAAVELYAVQTQEDTYAEEAAFVAGKIGGMLRQGTPVRKDGGVRPVEPEDIVILLRSPGSAAGYFQQAMEAQGIPCSAGDSTDLMQTQEIGTFRSLLQTIQNPRQDIPLISTLASPIFGFTADDLAQVRTLGKRGCFYDALCASPRAAHFLTVLEELRRISRQSTLTALLERCMTLTGLDSVYAAMPGGDARRANLQTFYQLAGNFEKENPRSLSQFLAYLDAQEQRGFPGAAGASGGCVRIMSIHKSKGLEFPVVFLCNLSRRFNQESLNAPILSERELGLGLSVADRETRTRYPSIAKRAIGVKLAAESRSEELRVLYVAMTRARDRLIMTYASKYLEKDIREIAQRQDADGGALLCRDASCPGDWVLLAATRRTEAGALHALGDRPAETQLGRYLWRIEVVQPPEEVQAASSAAQTSSALEEEILGSIHRALAFHYPHLAATQAPSKQTATGWKGREKDAEAAQDTRAPQQMARTWRAPAFSPQGDSGTAYGNATHLAMQYIRYGSCDSLQGVHRELRRLEEEGFLTGEQAAMVNAEHIARFFGTPLGQKLQSGAQSLREFKFSILDDGGRYGDGLEGEQVLLQGVVDCALLEEDGITVVDFKTDNVTEASLPQVVERYRLQVETYGAVLQRIYEKPMKARYLYFFRLGRFVPV